MGSISYVKKSLFDAPKGSVLIHASNAASGWGAGIAKEFSRRFPSADRQYRAIIKQHNVLGHFILFPNTDQDQHQVGTLVTSSDKAANVDSPEQILKNTKIALDDMMQHPLLRSGFITKVYSNKFNSGLFNVPWTDTVQILKKFCDDNNITWIVCDPDLID